MDNKFPIIKPEKPMKKYWYKYYREECPVCGREDVYKERQYTEKPESILERRVHEVNYDWCDAY